MRRVTPWIQFAVDAALIFFTWIVTLVVVPITSASVRSDGQSVSMALAATLVTCGLLVSRGLYAGRPALPRTEEISRLLSSLVAGSAFLALFAAFVDWALGAREVLLATILLFSLRLLVRGVIRDLSREALLADHRTPVIVVGTGGEAAELCDLLLDHPESQMRLLGVVGNHAVASRYALDGLWLGPADRLLETMHLHGAETVIMAPTSFRSDSFDELTTELLTAGHDVHLSVGASRVNQGRINTRSLSHEPLILLGHRTTRKWERAAKRGVDLAMSLVLLVLTAPAFLFIAVAVKLDSRGPVFFRSPRYGRDAEYFDMWKFRSMAVDAADRMDEIAELNDRNGPIFKVSNDPRVTRVGRIIRETSLDELPQFFNVLKGDMSLVGPRPALPAEEEAFEGDHRRRFQVRPGITGLWQVEARKNANFNAYRRLDLHYLDNWSLGLDARIFLATLEQVAVSILSLPLRRMLPTLASDGVETQSDDVVIDLRKRSQMRLEAAELRTKTTAATPPGGEAQPQPRAAQGKSSND